MHKILLAAIATCGSFFIITDINGREPVKQQAGSATLSFIENKGQIIDQYGIHRNDIDYKLDADGMTMFIGDGQIHWLRPDIIGS